MKKLLVLLIAALGLASVNAQTIRAGQTLTVAITGVPVSEKGRIDNTYTVSESGTVTMWMIGTVKASGMSKTAFASSIARKYQAAEIYTHPVFQVNSKEDITTMDKQIFTVGGQVRSAGQKQWTEGMTLYSAVQSAGGETAYGAMGRVKLYRNGRAYEYDLKRQDHKAVKVYPRDVIEVPQKNMIGR